MNKFFTRCLKRLVPLGLAASAAVVLLVPAAANATAYVIKLVQQGSNIVATGSGAFNLTGLTLQCSACIGTYAESINPSSAWLNVGEANLELDRFSGPITGPTSYGSGSSYPATSLASGSTLVFDGTGDDMGYTGFYLPNGYTSGNSLANSTTWADATFSSLGLTPGTYTWTWGTGADQSFTLDIGAGSVPEPAELGVFGFGVLLIGAFVGLRRRFA